MSLDEKITEELFYVADNYVLDDGIIKPVMNGEVVKPYDLLFKEPHKKYRPLERPEIVGEFAKLAGESEEKVLEFVRNYGLLGYGIINSIISSKVEMIGKLEQRQREGENKGDPLSWVISNAKAVKLVMDLNSILNDNQKDLNQKNKELKLIIDGLTIREQNGRLVLSYPIPLRGRKEATMAKRDIYIDSMEAALDIIADILNPNILGHSRQFIKIKNSDSYLINTEGRFKLKSVFKPNNLMDCVYWLLSNAVSSERIKTCEHCGNPFISDSEKRRFCPPLPNEEISKCMNRAKAKRIREDKKRKKQAFEWYSNGVPMETIADRLETNLSTIQSWIDKKGK
jgi:hypothetical protein